MGELELGAAAEATVQAYKELASDSAKCLALAMDQTCIQFLAYVVAEGSGTLVQTAVDTLELLSGTPECRPHLANTFGVLEALQEMADSDARYSEELKNQAASLFTCLQFSRHIASKEKVKTPESETKEPSKEVEEKKENATPKLSSKISLQSTDSTKSESKSEKSFLGPFNSRAKTVTLFVNGMTTHKHRQEVEDELVRVRGLISIVFDLSKSRVTCRVKRDLSVDKLVAALVVKVGTERPNVISPVEDLPEYLPEEETPVRDSGSAIATSGSFRETASTFISAAASLIHNSFYW
ncbi:Armadillo repeat-containing protein 1 [Armadillidium nasatum]|uniref:Armadillo repeat-containing protein 1 n=1 Tax=Armadillidium nasatum TaxID=96803 RepID=A0A5N5TAP2_9CRUS|nr:Armadillo repeat-containing protein 1 [Armadillidium nasatum]